MNDIDDGDEVSPARVVWLMDCFKAAFDELANHAGFNSARGYEMLNALALEASAVIKSVEGPELRDKFRRYFLTAFGASLEDHREDDGRRH
jgi:hypothetical protein